MEALKDPPVQSTIESVKLNTVNDGESVLLAEASLCHTSNGVAESTTSPLEATDAVYPVAGTDIGNVASLNETVPAPQPAYALAAESMKVGEAPDSSASIPPEEEMMDVETHAAVEHLLNSNNTAGEITEEIIETSVVTSDAILCNEVTIEGASVVVDSADASPDKVTLRTEVLVEKSEDDVPDSNDNDQVNANNLLNDLGQGIELSEALRSSNTTDLGENNNGTTGEEVFNKEELLDILEGNDEIPLGENADGQSKRRLEAQIAMQQLSRLHNHRSGNKKSNIRSPKAEKPKIKRRGRKKEKKENVDSTESNLQESLNNTTEVAESCEPEEKKNDSIVNSLVQDWDDDEPSEADQSKELLEETENIVKTTDQLVKSHETTVTSVEAPTITTDSPSVAKLEAVQNKSEDETPPQRRLGRVIKKKVPFDPDNPDTFTKGKIIKKEIQTEKDQPSLKKIKSELSPQRAKSKSPTSKLQWKKPAAKNTCKQNKRLTEVDKLLMDEGAVNMIYQLTPEAPKGKKNMRTKAEIIKKIQSSTPEGNKDTMKFRERKKEVKCPDGEAKKVLGGKSSRSSLSGSVKSPSACEDFENHSADDSIIYRRHSSSSYSSACMSPRRLSDNEVGNARAAVPSTKPTIEPKEEVETPDIDKSTDVFMADAAAVPTTGPINKDDCLSIKEILNTKLSLALKKRKRESTIKTDKPTKQKRASKNSSVEKDSIVKNNEIQDFKHVSVNFDQRLAEICIMKTGSICSIEMLKEFEQALLNIDSKKDISVTLLTSECGTLCSDLHLAPLLGQKMEGRTNYAHAIAEGVRSLLCVLESHSKLVVSGVWGACRGMSLAVVALSDVAVGSEHATFAVGAAPPLPGGAVLTARCSRLSQSLINDLVIFGRRVSGPEAAAGGLVSRSVPGAGAACARLLARDLAAQPAQSVLLRKQLLKLNKSNDSQSTFLAGLERERDLLVEYWTSVEGQETLRAALTQ